MKKVNLLLTAIALLCFVGNSFAQQCSSHIFRYDGPENTSKLEKLLNESTNPILQNLDASTKASIVANLVFKGGTPVGMENIDDNLKKLYATNGALVFGAIFGMQVVMNNDDSRPVVIEMSVSTYMENFHNDPMRYAITPVYSLCKNCYFGWPPIGGPYCCQVGGNGCWDKLVVLPDGKYYKIIN